MALARDSTAVPSQRGATGSSLCPPTDCVTCQKKSIGNQKSSIGKMTEGQIFDYEEEIAWTSWARGKDVGAATPIFLTNFLTKSFVHEYFRNR
jgi:hypothetical protein